MEKPVRYDANQPTPPSNQLLEPGDPTAEAIRLLVGNGCVVTIGPTGGAVRPYHVLVYKLGKGMISREEADFRAALLELAGVEE